MAKVEFHDFRIQVTEALENAAIAFLYEASGELEAQTKRRSSQESYGGMKAQSLWTHIVDESAKEGAVGSPEEAAFWEELGTGEYALNKNGRKGWWVYIEGGSGYKGSTKSYSSQEEAEDAAAYIREKYHVNAVATNGRKPNRPLHRAYTENKAKIIRRAEQIFKERLK